MANKDVYNASTEAQQRQTQYRTKRA